MLVTGRPMTELNKTAAAMPKRQVPKTVEKWAFEKLTPDIAGNFWPTETESQDVLETEQESHHVTVLVPGPLAQLFPCSIPLGKSTRPIAE